MSKYLRIMVVLIVALIALQLASCGASENSAVFDSDAKYETADGYAAPSESGGFTQGSMQYDYAIEEEAVEIAVSEEQTESQNTQRKIIYTAWANVQTKQYDESVASLNKLCEKYGAYFENASNYGNRLDYQTERYSVYKIRIPVDNFNSFRNEIGNIGTIIESGENNTDITEKYFDIEARLESAKIREERVLVLLENSSSLDDVLALERELSDIRYEIETMTGTLRKYDSLISYATFDLEIVEVVEYTAPVVVPKTFGERVEQNFKDGWRDFVGFWQRVAIDISYSVFAIVTWIVIIVVAIVIIRVIIKQRKKAEQKHQEKMRERAEQLNKQYDEKNNKDTEKK